MKIELILPLPVTVNKLTYNNRAKNGGKGGRSKTEKAKAWYREAQVQAMPFVKSYKAICNHNINTRARYWNFGKKAYDLAHLREDFPNISYTVEYRFYFCGSYVCDIANREKQLSDFLVDIGLLLDDSFIDDMRLRRMPDDPVNPRCEIKINSLDVRIME